MNNCGTLTIFASTLRLISFATALFLDLGKPVKMIKHDDDDDDDDFGSNFLLFEFLLDCLEEEEEEEDINIGCNL